MKISNRVREQVVELLRCAVDTRASLLYTNCELMTWLSALLLLIA